MFLIASLLVSMFFIPPTYLDGPKIIDTLAPDDSPIPHDHGIFDALERATSRLLCPEREACIEVGW